jgi:hypothetical protein
MRPDLLSAFKEAKTEVKINGVGGVQLSTRETGYLPDFLEYVLAPIPRPTY